MNTTLSMPSTISSAVSVSRAIQDSGVRDPIHRLSTIIDGEESAVPYAEPTEAGFTLPRRGFARDGDARSS